MPFLTKILTIIIASIFLLGCGSDSCDILLFDPTGLWTGTLTKTEDSCPSDFRGQETIPAQYDVFVTCDSNGSKIQMSDQNGTDYAFDSLLLNEFTVKNVSTPLRGIGLTTTTEVTFDDGGAQESDVTVTQRLEGSGVSCKIKYSGKLKR